jgi:hypothetical protein
MELTEHLDNIDKAEEQAEQQGKELFQDFYENFEWYYDERIIEYSDKYPNLVKHEIVDVMKEVLKEWL